MKKIFTKIFLTVIICTISFQTFAHNPNIILFGLPGAGKGTLSQRLIETGPYSHICPGNLFRAEVRNQTEFGNRIKSILDKGRYLPEEVTFNFLKNKIIALDTRNAPIILDGYPRSVEAVNMIDSLFEDLNIKQTTLVVYLKIDPKKLTDRVLNRSVCNKCNKVYTKKAVSCDKCNVRLERRLQDTDDILKKRIEHYLRVLNPVLESFKERGYRIVEVDAGDSPEKVFTRVSALITEKSSSRISYNDRQ